MIKYLVITPVAMALTAVAGIAVCRAMGRDPHIREMLLAYVICGAAAELAAVPALMQSGTHGGALFRAAFIGTILHLGVILLLALTVIFVMRPSLAFACWVLGFYWLTLLGLCSAFALLMRAPVLTKPLGN